MSRPPGGRLRRGVAIFAIALLGAALGACSGDDASGSAWPDVDISDVRGASTTSGAVLTSGRPAIVTIWATTCAPCKEELPRLQALADQQDAVDIAAVNLGDDPDDIAAFADTFGLDLPMYIDTEGRLAEALGVASVPATVFVGAGGEIVERHLGALSAADLETAAAQLLAGAA